jgi:hypothetical protein
MSRGGMHETGAGVERGCGETVLLHARHPLHGHEVTWRIIPLPADSDGGESFLVQRADGHVAAGEMWGIVDKETFVLNGEGVRELVGRITARAGMRKAG